MARIIYIGDGFVHCTSAQRAAALMRLGHDVTIVNSRAMIPRHAAVSGLNVRTGYRFFAPLIGLRVKAAIHRAARKYGGAREEVVWIDGCAELPPSLYRWLRSRGTRIVNYNVDDPFGGRDRRKWDLYLAAVRYHDLTVVLRNENIQEAKRHGARQVMRVYFCYDPVAHAPVALSAQDRQHFASKVAFVGTWMPERGPFLARLVAADVPLSIWGDWWHKASEWPRLRQCWRGPAIYGPDYNKAIQCADVALGLLSKGNRDRHTTRSLEVPFLRGAVFCGERTDEHQFLLSEGREAAFWGHADECILRCRELLLDETRRKSMADAAQARIITHRLSNDEVMAEIIGKLTAPCGRSPLASQAI
jgi:hypothetical protein